MHAKPFFNGFAGIGINRNLDSKCHIIPNMAEIDIVINIDDDAVNAAYQVFHD